MSGAMQPGWQLQSPAWLLGIAVALGWAWWRARRPRTVVFAGLDAVVGDTELPSTWRSWGCRLPTLLGLLACCAWWVALARPVLVATAPPTPPGHDVVVCLDRSSSMAATDLQPGRTRLDVARRAAIEFAARRPHDRVGCVQFARYADLVCPPTLDRGSFAELVLGVPFVARDGAEDATAIGGAVAFAARQLERSPGRQRVIVLLTDGEENVAVTGAPQEIAPGHAAQLCRALGVHVHTVVVGGGGDAGAAAVDTRAVQELAAATGGHFFIAANAAALRRVGEAIDALEGVAFVPPTLTVTEWFAAPALLALLLLAVASGLRRGPSEVLP